jgi:hypothetical protein
MATKSTQYIIRVGSENRAGDGYSYLAALDTGAIHPYSFASLPRRGMRFVGRPAAEEAALTLARLMAERGYNPPVRLVPARGGMETGFRPEKVA